MSLSTTGSGSKTSSSSSMKMSSSSSSSSTSSSKKTTTTSSKSTFTSHMSSSSKKIGFNSNANSFADTFGSKLGLDMNSDLLKLTGSDMRMDDKMTKMRREMLHLAPLEMAGPSAQSLVKLDSNSIQNYFDKDNDLFRFNFDVNSFSSESVDIKCDGNKIEVHAKKTQKTDDGEKTEEYSRTYEMPTSKAIDVGNITSSFYKDGVLTIELPSQGFL